MIVHVRITYVLVILMCATPALCHSPFEVEDDPESALCALRCVMKYPYCKDEIGCHEKQELVKKGSYCGCCDACYTIADEGENCFAKHERAQYTKCRKGLHCDILYHICIDYTSLFDMIMAMLSRR